MKEELTKFRQENEELKEKLAQKEGEGLHLCTVCNDSTHEFGLSQDFQIHFGFATVIVTSCNKMTAIVTLTLILKRFHLKYGKLYMVEGTHKIALQYGLTCITVGFILLCISSLLVTVDKPCKNNIHGQ